jgi:hypothetical protein
MELKEYLLKKDYFNASLLLEDYEIQFPPPTTTLEPFHPFIQLSCYLLLKDYCSARFLIKRTLHSTQEFQLLSLVAKDIVEYQFTTVYTRLNNLHQHFSNTHPLLSSIVSDLIQFQRESLFFLSSQCFDSISQSKAAVLLGIPLEQIQDYVRERGWDIDASAGWLLPKKPVSKKDHGNFINGDLDWLDKMTKNVLFLEHIRD